MAFQVRSYGVPEWVVLLMFLAALALLPFAFLLALGVGALALVASVARAILAGPPRGPEGGRVIGRDGSPRGDAGPPILDADFEVKDGHEKDQRHEGP